jgi:hypothetical protein
MRKKILKFVEKLKAVAGEGRRCDMGTTRVAPVCRTPGCHGGWAGIALGFKDIYDYTQGAHALAQYLGFTDRYALATWARDNPGIWGNTSGYDMFLSPAAFGQDDECFPVQVLIDHWEGVANRLK